MVSISFDLVSLNVSSDVREFDNPCTGERCIGPDFYGLTYEEHQAVLRLLDSSHAELIKTQDGGQLCISFADGGFVYVDSYVADHASRPVTVTISIRPAPTKGVVEFLMAFARASNMAMVSRTTEPKQTICFPTTPAEKVPAGWPKTVKCETSLDVQSVLEVIFDTFRKGLKKLRQQWS